MSDFRLKTTVDPKTLHQVFLVCGSEWGRPDPEAFAAFQTRQLVDAILKGRAAKAFYLESKEGEIASVCVVSQHKAFYKDAGSAGLGVPDPAAFGVNQATGLRLSYVFTLAKFRGLGLMEKLVRKAIALTEEEALKKELEKLSDKKGSFKSMVSDHNGQVDPQLATYYLGKRYFWYLYSAIKTTYSKFGFKPYPVDGYIVPQSVLDSEAAEAVQKLLSGNGNHESVPGKKLTLLDASKQQDQHLISLILQLRELELLTDLNKTIFHLELSGGRRSLSSLTNVHSALSLTRLGSHNEFSTIAEKMGGSHIDPASPKQLGLGKKSSVQSLAMPKFFLQPDEMNLRKQHASDEARVKKFGGEEAYGHIKGAILTNDLQQKSYYILWSQIMDGRFCIVSLGELKVDPFGVLSDPSRVEDQFGRRRSSFTGLNDLGGFNFQDLELLVSTAVLVGKKRNPQLDRIYVTSQGLPDTIPASVLYDFFINYLPRTVPNVVKKEEEGAVQSNTVELVENFADQDLLPMAKRFGLDSPEFELDWIASGSLLTWG